MNLEALLADRLAVALAAVAGGPVDPAVRVSRHADFQSNAVLALARDLNRPPRDVAAQVSASLAAEAGLTVEVSGPGFLNLTVDDGFLTGALASVDERLGVPPVAHPERIVLDYSGPNVAKEMHVGNLRSTIIGDALARILEWQGHEVIRVNHLGDWGTPFGMLIEHMIDVGGEGHSLGDLTRLYRDARVRFDTDEGFRRQAQLRVVALQGGDPVSRDLWRRLVGQHDLAVAFSVFYERCPILRSSGEIRASRLALADLTARTLERGLTLLGIDLPAEM
jgi:arginyl-tRNA synthetase